MSLLDAAVPPPRFLTGQAWAGYLSSPTVYHQPGRPGVPFWTAADLRAAMHAGGVLPVYVAPLDHAGYVARHDAAHDAADALRQIRALNPARPVVALDTEQRAFDAAPNRAVTYAADFQQAFHVAGGITVHYGPRAFLDRLHLSLSGARWASIGGLIPWLAWWTADPTFPLHYASVWAWQYDHDKKIQGTTADVSRRSAGFPLCRPHPAATTPPAPTAHPSAPAPAAPADVELAAAFDRWRHAKGV